MGAPSVRQFDPRFIVLAVIGLALIVVMGFALSNCAGHIRSASSDSPSQDAAIVSSASASVVSAAASASAASAATSAAENTASASAASPASASSASATTTQAATANAQEGDVSYPVAQAAKLAYRNVDFAVDPSRTTWNYDKPNGHKTIYLTFDDGPSALTEQALDILDKYDCKATFFVTGQNPDYFPWIKEAYRRGHTIGLHSMSHDYGTIYSSSDAFWADMDELGKVVKDQIGYVPCFIRFPGGASNTISAESSQGIMTTLAEQVLSRGYQYYDWSLSCGDGAVLTTEETIAAGCEPTDEENAIYLLHDGAAKETTIEALPTIIEYYQAQGYKFEALDRNSIVYHHPIAN